MVYHTLQAGLYHHYWHHGCKVFGHIREIRDEWSIYVRDENGHRVILESGELIPELFDQFVLDIRNAIEKYAEKYC
jgi:hypothetical protein